MDAELQALCALDRRLVEVAKSIKVLTYLAWPSDRRQIFLDAWRRGEPSLPEISYAPVDLSTERTALEVILSACDRAHPIGDFLYRTTRSYSHVTEMIEVRGKPRFSELSKRLYGSPSDPVAMDHTTTAAAAARLLDVTRDYHTSCHLEEADYCVTPQAVASAIAREAARLDVHKVAVVVDPGLSAKAAAGATRIRIRGSTCFSDADVAQLVNHELLVHTLTALNGQVQPHLTSLGLGAPRTTRSQEGLALFSELITNSIDINRLRRIAARVLAIDMATSGADFIEVFRFFIECGQTESESFGSAERVFRGGDVRGGGAFTKDAVYLQGFVRIHRFLRDSIHDGRLEDPQHLLCGRLAASDVPRLEAFFRSGFIARPRYQPPWVENHSRLVAFLLHSSFMAELRLEESGRRSSQPPPSDSADRRP